MMQTLNMQVIILPRGQRITIQVIPQKSWQVKDLSALALNELSETDS